MTTRTKKEQAQSLLQSNRLAEAKALYTQICKDSPRDWEAWHMLSAVHGMSGEFAEAEACTRKVIAMQPAFVGAHINLGNTLMAQGKHDEAEASFRRVLQLKPDEAQAHNNLGNLLKARGRLAEAETCYRAALKYAPNYPDAHSNLGIVLQEKGKLEEALASYQRALRLKPDHADALYNTGHGLLAKGQLEESVAFFQQLTRLRPDDHKTWSFLGSVLGQLKKFDQAVACCQRAITLQPEYAEAYFNLGSVFQGMGQKDKAEEMYREALRLKPDMANAQYFLATLGAEKTPDHSPHEYVKELFDGYAEKFDKHLVQELGYKTPELLNQAVRRALDNSSAKFDILDLGCGTGLGGAQFRDIARRLVGVDLSPKMIIKARELGIYDELIVGDVLAPLSGADRRYGLIIATDVFVYIGDLAPIFAGCYKALQPGGLFSFSVEAGDEGGTFMLRPSGRYAHATDYVKRLATDMGMEEISRERVTLRKEAGNPIIGDIYVFRRH